MFQIPETSNSMFSNTHMITPLQDISVRWRHSTKSTCITIDPHFLLISKTTASHVPLVPMPNLCTINLMDFIEKLPLSSGYTSILVIVNHLSKWSHFILTHDTITSLQLMQLFVLHVFSKHGVPSHVTSDHSMEFVSHFFQSLRTALDLKVHFILDIIPKVMDKPNELIRL